MSAKQAATYHGADIVTRLRAYGPESDYDGVMQEAAQEIEKLRARVITTRDQLANVPDGSLLIDSFGVPWQIDTLFSEEGGDARRLFQFGEEDEHPISRVVLPVTVVWSPDE